MTIPGFWWLFYIKIQVKLTWFFRWNVASGILLALIRKAKYQKENTITAFNWKFPDFFRLFEISWQFQVGVYSVIYGDHIRSLENSDWKFPRQFENFAEVRWSVQEYMTLEDMIELCPWKIPGKTFIQGVPKNLLESGAHKTPFLDTITWYAGCWHIFIDILLLAV